MALTVTAIGFLMGLGALFGAGLLKSDWGDAGTPLLLGLLSSVVWGTAGLSSFSVASEAYAGTQPMVPLAVVNIGISMLVFGLTLYTVKDVVQQSTGSTTDALVGGD